MYINYDDSFLEIYDRLIQSGLDSDQVCLLLACFLTKHMEQEDYESTTNEKKI